VSNSNAGIVLLRRVRPERFETNGKTPDVILILK